VSVPLPEPGSVRALLVDLGGVVVRPAFERVASALSAHGVAAGAEALAAAEPLARRQLDRPPAEGLQTDAQRGWLYFDLVLAGAGIARDARTDAALAEVKAWHDVHCLWEDVLDGAREALARLRAAGLRTAAVSNANGTVAVLLERLGLTALFDVILDSQVVGIEKPDPRLFRLALEGLRAQPEEAVHVGDLYHVDVAGARAAGLRAVLVDEAGLYPEVDCPRVRSLAELAVRLVPGAAGTGISATLPRQR
jgi:putative hydrolase of the HAD superfamily